MSTIVAALVVSVLVVGYVRSGFQGESLPPAFELADIPFELGSWKGEEVEILDETVQVLKCHSHINRIYRDSLAHTLTLHVGAWMNSELVSPAPHHPEVCYPSAGWKTVGRRKVRFETDLGEIPCELILHEKDGTTIVTAHWFMLGDIYFTDSAGFQAQRLQFWGQKAWPSTIKYLMQTPAPSIEAARPIIEDFSKQIASSIRELQREKHLPDNVVDRSADPTHSLSE